MPPMLRASLGDFFTGELEPAGDVEAGAGFDGAAPHAFEKGVGEGLVRICWPHNWIYRAALPMRMTGFLERTRWRGAGPGARHVSRRA
jgi:hypothetical protein